MKLVALAALLAGAIVAFPSSTPGPADHPAAAFIEQDEHGIPEYSPTYSSYCRKSGHSPFQSTNVNLISGDGIVQVGSNRGCYTPQNEPSLAVSPTNPKNLVAGANDYRLCCDSDGHNDGTGWAYYSRDGGATWHDVLLPGLTRETSGTGAFSLMDSAGDPAVAFAPDGKTVYYANIVFSRSDEAISGIAISVSHDAGATWLKPHMVFATNDLNYFHDKEWVTVAPDGTVLVSWTVFASQGAFYVSPIVGSVSSDGKHWTKPVVLSGDRPMNQGSQPLVGPDGTIYVVFESANTSTWDADIAAFVLKAGSSGPRVIELGRAYDGSGCFPQNQDSRDTLTGEQFRTSDMPAVSMDPKTGTVAVVWADGEKGCGLPSSNSQVKVVYLNGTSHSLPQTITSGADKAFPSVAYRNGKVVVSYYTRSYDPNGIGLDYAYSTSTDGWTEHRLTDASSNPYMQFKGAFIGDYSQIVLGSDGLAHAVWTDSRGGDQNILSATFAP